MSSHSECGYEGCPDCREDGSVNLARELLEMKEKLEKGEPDSRIGQIVIWPDSMLTYIQNLAGYKTLQEES